MLDFFCEHSHLVTQEPFETRKQKSSMVQTGCTCIAAAAAHRLPFQCLWMCSRGALQLRSPLSSVHVLGTHRDHDAVAREGQGGWQEVDVPAVQQLQHCRGASSQGRAGAGRAHTAVRAQEVYNKHVPSAVSGQLFLRLCFGPLSWMQGLAAWWQPHMDRIIGQPGEWVRSHASMQDAECST